MKPSIRLTPAIFAGTLAAATLLMTGATASAAPPGDVILYDTVYYSDASMTVEVGRNQGLCYGGWGTPVWAGASPLTDGQETAFSSQERVGRCLANGETIYE